MVKLNEGKDVSDAYITKSPDGKTLPLIGEAVGRNKQKQAIGMLCVNSNLDAPFQSMMQSLLANIHSHFDHSVTAETFARNNDEMMHSSIENVREQVVNDTTITPSKKSREIITRLHDLGITILKIVHK